MPSTSQGHRPSWTQKEPTPPTPWSLTSTLQTSEKANSYCLSCLGHGCVTAAAPATQLTHTLQMQSHAFLLLDCPQPSAQGKCGPEELHNFTYFSLPQNHSLQSCPGIRILKTEYKISGKSVNILLVFIFLSFCFFKFEVMSVNARWKECQVTETQNVLVLLEDTYQALITQIYQLII